MKEIKTFGMVAYNQGYSLGNRDIKEFWEKINKDPRVKTGTDDYCYISEYMITRPTKSKQYIEIISKSLNFSITDINWLRERVAKEMKIVKGTIEKIVMGELTEIEN